MTYFLFLKNPKTYLKLWLIFLKGGVKILSVISIIFFIQTNGITQTCPTKTGFTTRGSIGDDCYYTSDNAFSFTDAVTDAQINGGHLVSINDAAENTQLASWLENDVWFIGLSNPGTGLEWAYGDPVTFINWSPGEPNGTPPYSVSMWTFVAPGDTWFDEPIPGRVDRKYILEIPDGLIAPPLIPTMSQWALFILGLCLTTLAVVTIRRRVLAIS